MKRRGGSTAILCCLLALSLLAVAATPNGTDVALVLRRADDDGIMLCRRDAVGQIVSLAFTHSMYGGLVTEQYVVQPHQTLARTSIVVDNASAAEYYGFYGEIEAKDGRFSLQVPPLQLRGLRFITDSTGDYRLRVGGQEHRLRPTKGSADHLVLTVEDLPMEKDIDLPC
jgi:hypothetical protein